VKKDFGFIEVVAAIVGLTNNPNRNYQLYQLLVKTPNNGVK